MKQEIKNIFRIKQREWSPQFRTILIGIVVFQMILIFFGVAVKEYKIATGTVVYVETEPVDPRDLLLGAYTRLGYEFSRVPIDAVGQNGVVYVSLQEGEDGVWKVVSYSAAQPSSDVYLKGRVSSYWKAIVAERRNMADVLGGSVWDSNRSRRIPALFGIEAYFDDPDGAQQLEAVLRRGQNAQVIMAISVTKDGEAILIGVHEIRGVDAETDIDDIGSNMLVPEIYID